MLKKKTEQDNYAQLICASTTEIFVVSPTPLSGGYALWSCIQQTVGRVKFVQGIGRTFTKHRSPRVQETCLCDLTAMLWRWLNAEH